ncbi:hypothetical protein Thal_0313 [Thermocrinis albus DSM 14484]|uniref:Uncharacterized protein n=1 Tax=Thermocrinis albus (strain DSM 14484 / JCM 11386 / HI 11/12) TaxID=638303 RepID=D3SP61_THEAH|nr:hypothetical protein Thal_0313 [Thermocrinis albus DSM 14484]
MYTQPKNKDGKKVRAEKRLNLTLRWAKAKMKDARMLPSWGVR